MYITNYQMHNVLKVYTNNLSKNKFQENQKTPAAKSLSDSINISAEGKRRNIIEKVAADIVNRITSKGPQETVDHEIVNRLQDEMKDQAVKGPSKDANLVYNVIKEDQEKKTNILAIEDSSFLVKRLEQLARETVDKNLET